MCSNKIRQRANKKTDHKNKIGRRAFDNKKAILGHYLVDTKAKTELTKILMYRFESLLFRQSESGVK
jgi:hypothetical protein